MMTTSSRTIIVTTTSGIPGSRAPLMTFYTSYKNFTLTHQTRPYPRSEPEKLGFLADQSLFKGKKSPLSKLVAVMGIVSLDLHPGGEALRTEGEAGTGCVLGPG